MIILFRYSTVYDARRGIYIIVSQEELPLCSICGDKLRAYGYRKRHVISGDGSSHVYELQRLRCDTCRTVQLWLPFFISAGRYYDRETVRGTVAGTLTSCPADDSTIRRWKRTEAPAEELQPVSPVQPDALMIQCGRTVKKEDE